jgi:TPR repeat protein
MGVCAAAIATVVFTSLSSDAAREFFRASFADLIPAPLAATLSASPHKAAPARVASAQMPEPEQKPSVRNLTTADLGRAPGTISTTDQPREPVPVAVEAPRIEAPKPPAPVIHHLDANEISAALIRADSLIASGDIAAARLVLQRAADSEDGKAAVKLAGTYDPDVLAKLGVHGIVSDPAKAREWYEKAKTFGAPEAAMRLEVLASQHR